MQPQPKEFFIKSIYVDTNLQQITSSYKKNEYERKKNTFIILPIYLNILLLFHSE